MDIFDHSEAKAVVNKLTSGSDKDAILWVHRLQTITQSRAFPCMGVALC